jgi:hypothetical protein
MQLRRALVLGAVLVLSGASTARAQASFSAIWGSGPDDVWVVGDAPAALHFDGRTWNEVPYGVPLSGGINTVWGAGPRDIFAAGDGGMILRWNGQAWTRLTVPSDRQIVALAGRTGADVFALTQSNTDRDPPTLLHWDGRAWTGAPLPMGFRANALALQGGDVLVAGFVMVDPTPSERRTYGVVARRRAGQWSMTGWDGKAVSDRLLAGAGWSRLYAAGTTLLLVGAQEDDTPVLALATGAAWTLLPPAVSAMGGARVAFAFLGADRTPVALNAGGGLERYAAGRWTAVEAANPYAMAMQAQQNPQAAAQLNPEAMMVQMLAWDLGETQAVWGPSASDFYAVTSNGRIVRVQGSAAAVVYEAACANPMQASMNPICRVLLQQRPQTPIPAPTRRPKP